MEAKTSTPETTEKPDGAEAVRAAAKNGKLSPEQENAAVEWFLSDSEPIEKVIEFNVGTENEPRWIPWTVQPVDLEVLRRIRKNSQTTRRGEGMDEVEANLKIVVAGTLNPDLRDMARQRGVPAPEEALRLRFASKPGLLGQIAGEILSLSGYDAEDMRDPTTVGN
jgi:hypothetical protein